MLIDAVTLEAVGPFRDRLQLGPFAPGLNVLAQPNEWGKSTFVRSLCHAFFDRYAAEHEGIRQMRPAGTTLAPRIEVEFQVRGERFRLVKRFLEGRLCELSTSAGGGAWELAHESAAADQRLRELLGAPALKTGPARAETWGMIRYLWCRQEEPPDWPDWAGEEGMAARRKLATVEIDRAVRALASALGSKAEEQFSPKTGRVRASGPLDVALREQEQLERAKRALEEKRAAQQGLEADLARLAGELPRLREEKARLAEEAARAKAEAERVEKLERVLAQDREALGRAETALLAVKRDADEREALTRADAEGAATSERLEGEAKAAGARRAALAEKLEEARRAHREQSERRGHALESARGAQALLRGREAAEEAAQLEGLRERARAVLNELSALRADRARLAAPAPAQLKQWRKLERALREDGVRLEALSLTVLLKPQRESAIEGEADSRPLPRLRLRPGEEEKVQASQTLHLRLEGWGTLEISSGAAEPAALRAAIDEGNAELVQALAAAGLASLAEGEARAQQAAQLEEQIRLQEAKLSGLLGSWKSVEELELRLAALEAARGQRRPVAGGSAEVEQLSLPTLRTQVESERSAADAAAEEEARLAKAVGQLRDALSAQAMEEAHFAAQRREAEERRRGLTARQESLSGRYPEGIAGAVQGAQREFVKAEARLAEGLRQLPPEAEKIQGRAERAARALAQVEEELRGREAEHRRLEIILGERGAEGGYSREIEVEEKLEQTRASVAALKLEGHAARLLGELIRRREHAAIRHVLRPLEERLSAVFRSLTGVVDRRVWFNEELRVEGVGRSREEMVRFDDLSRGAREQLLLGLRAAIALELAATEGPQCLILDDVLVHTDAARHQNVLDFLQELAGSTQILLLTCHAERYRGVGHAVHARR